MFTNRIEAGQLLARKLEAALKTDGLLGSSFVVLGIPRGGVVIAKEVAKVLSAPLDITVVKKISPPGNKELALGAVGKNRSSLYIDKQLVKDLNVSQKELETEINRVRTEINRRENLYRQGRAALILKNKIVIIVDDGTATGATMLAALRAVWLKSPKSVILGLPVVPKDTLPKLEKEADKVIYLETPEPFFSIGQFYNSFEQLSDKQVINLLS